MNQDKWIEQLRDKLADHQVAPPEGLWENIEAALNRRVRLIALRRWAVAATLAALIATGGYWWMNSGEGKTESGELATAAKNVNQADVNHEDENHGNVNHGNVNHGDSPLCEQGAQRPDYRGTVPVIHQLQESALLPEKEQEPAELMATVPVTHQPDPEDTKVPDSPVSSSPQEKEQQVLQDLDKQILELSKRQKKSMSLGLYAMNSFGKQTGRNGVLMSPELLQKFNTPSSAASRTRTPVYLAGYEERQKHYQPLSLGLSASYPLTQRLSLTSGIVFTRLQAEFLYIMPTNQIKKEQTLGYLGIPLQLSYRLWKYHGLKVYLTAGGQADWNITTDLKSNDVTQKMDKDRMQWSVNGALGIQYDIIPQLGLYAEPGIKYYFDNGSRLQTFFKDKPTNFSLQLGLRWNLSK